MKCYTKENFLKIFITEKKMGYPLQKWPVL